MTLVRLFHSLGALKKVPRTGWMNKGVRASESVADHSFRVSFITMVLSDYLDLDTCKMLKLSLIHDLAECVIGDIPPDVGIPKHEKGLLESDAIARLLNSIPFQQYYMKLWQEWNSQSSKEALIVNEIDKLEMAIQAVEYQSQLSAKDLSSFIKSASQHITNPMISSIMEAVIREVDV